MRTQVGGKGAAGRVSYRRSTPLFETQRTVELLNEPIAFARTFLEFLPVEDFYCARRVLDCFFSLKASGRKAYARPVSSQHSRQEIMGDTEEALIDPVLHDQ